MSSLIFLFGLIGFALVAHWTYINDQLGPKAGSKGLLRMSDTPAEDGAAAKKRGPKWRQRHGEAPARAEVRTRWAPRGRSPQGQEPAWKRRLG